VTPDGRLPDASDHVVVPIAPLTLGVSSYAAPTCVAGASGIERTNGGGSTVTDSVETALFVGHDGS
jgi:hypothetical protein